MFRIMEEKVVTVGSRRIGAEFANNLKNVLAGDFTLMGESVKEAEEDKAFQVWLRIKLADGQVLMVATGDLLDMHLKGSKVFDGEPVEGEKCQLREGLKIGIKDKRVTFA